MKRLQYRIATAAEFTAKDPVLARDEIGIEKDTGKEKIGNGTSRWSLLAYFPDTATVVARLDDLTARVEALEGSTPQAPLLPYGSGIGTDTIANLILGVDQRWLSQRFRADITGTPVNHRWVTKVGGAYSAGNGGTIRVSLMADDGTGKPYGPELDGYTVTHPSVTSHTNWAFDNKNAALIAGNVYHLVFHNIEASPDSNYCSLNNILVFNATTPRQPRYPDTDLAVLAKPVATDTWTVQPEYTPTFDLTYANGYHQGQGYVDMQSASGSIIAGPSNMIRETITVTGQARTVSTVYVRIARTSGTGNLTIRLEDATESLIDSCAIATGSVPILTRTADASAGIWVSGTLSQPRTLQVGQTYHLRLSTDSSTSLWMRLLKQGYNNGYSAGMFDDGYAEESTDGGTSWGAPSGITAGQGDLQFHLT